MILFCIYPEVVSVVAILLEGYVKLEGKGCMFEYQIYDECVCEREED